MPRSRRPSPQTVALLEALTRTPEEWRYGYDLCLEVGLQAGTVYPILMRLADRGLLETSWESDPPAGRPRRHLYRLTADGLSFTTEFATSSELAEAETVAEPESEAAPHRPVPPSGPRRGAGPRPSTA